MLAKLVLVADALPTAGDRAALDAIWAAAEDRRAFRALADAADAVGSSRFVALAWSRESRTENRVSAVVSGAAVGASGDDGWGASPSA